MTNVPGYRYLFSPDDVSALLMGADGEWTAIAWSDVQRLRGLSVRCSEICITAGGAQIRIGVRSREIVNGVEVFRPTAILGDWPRPAWYKPPLMTSSDEFMSVFIGKQRTILVGARSHALNEGSGSTSMLVEDTIVFRHASGQTAYVLPDLDFPGNLIVAREPGAIPSPGADFEYLRCL